MPRRHFLPHEEASLKFEECISCIFAVTKTCRTCDAGENFEDADTPAEVCDLMNLWE